MVDLSKDDIDLAHRHLMQSRSVRPSNAFVEFKKEEIEQSIPDRFEKQVDRYCCSMMLEKMLASAKSAKSQSRAAIFRQAIGAGRTLHNPHFYPIRKAEMTVSIVPGIWAACCPMVALCTWNEKTFR